MFDESKPFLKYKDRECEVVFVDINSFENDKGKEIRYAAVEFRVYKENNY